MTECKAKAHNLWANSVKLWPLCSHSTARLSGYWQLSTKISLKALRQVSMDSPGTWCQTRIHSLILWRHPALCWTRVSFLATISQTEQPNQGVEIRLCNLASLDPSSCWWNMHTMPYTFLCYWFASSPATRFSTPQLSASSSLVPWLSSVHVGQVKTIKDSPQLPPQSYSLPILLCSSLTCLLPIFFFQIHFLPLWASSLCDFPPRPLVFHLWLIILPLLV